MRRRLAAFAFASLLTPCLAVTPESLKPMVDEAIAPLRNAGKFAQVVGILIGGKVHIFAFGTLASDSSQPVDGDTLFEIGSITKTFTALVLADMVERKLVKYDDPVQHYLPPDCHMPTRGGKQITLQHLATHTSGLPTIPPELALYTAFSKDPYARYTPALLCAFLSKHELTRDIGAQWEYSNLGMGLLGYTLARKAGCSYERLIVDRICKPLGLNDTCVTLSADQEKRLADGYDEDGEPTPHWHGDALAGCGVLLSSAKDLLRYAAAQLDPGTGPLAPAIRQSQVPRFDKTGAPNLAQALGWLVVCTDEGKPKLCWHNGGTGGFDTYLGFLIERRIGVVVLSNRSSDEGATAAGMQLLVKLGKATSSAPASTSAAAP